MLQNKMLIAALLAWAIAQAIKVVTALIHTRKFDYKRIMGAGGMPSSHTSFTVALVTSIGKYEGVTGSAFAIALVMALVVMYDAMNVRRETGEQAKILNYMMDNWAKNVPKLFEKDLKELIGHNPLEVIAGAVLGVAIGFLV